MAADLIEVQTDRPFQFIRTPAGWSDARVLSGEIDDYVASPQDATARLVHRPSPTNARTLGAKLDFLTPGSATARRSIATDRRRLEDQRQGHRIEDAWSPARTLSLALRRAAGKQSAGSAARCGGWRRSWMPLPAYKVGLDQSPAP
jgi:hypothetical protein